MHVGFVIYGGLDRTSGGFRYDRKLIEHLEARGDDVEVIALPWRSYPRSMADGLSPAVRRRLNRPFDVLLEDELCHPSLWRHNPRLDAPRRIVSLVHLLRSGARSSRLTPLYRAIEGRYLRTVDAAVATSSDTRDRTRSLADVPTLVATPAGREGGSAVLPEAVDRRAREGPLEVAFVGNLLPRKNLGTLLEGLARAAGRWRLTVVGSHDADPTYAASTVELATELGIDDRVAFAGEVDDATLEDVLERSHVLAVPASYEGFGMVYLEAMEYGVVPIASAVGGAGDIVADGRNGFLVDPDDPGRIAGLVETLDEDRGRLAALGRAALATADAHPGWAETMDAVRSFLLELVEPTPDASFGTDRRDGPRGEIR